MTNFPFPLEGRLTHLTQGEAEAIAMSFLNGKKPPVLEAERKLYMTHGAPGAAKSVFARQRFNSLATHKINSTVYVSADENGAMDAITGYREGIAAARTRGERFRLWKTYQNDADYIRSLTLNMAIDGGFSVFLDTTGAGPKGLETIQTMRGRGYPVQLHSFYAPVDISVERVVNRERQADQSLMLSRRIEAFRNFAPLVAAANTAVIHFSAKAHEAPSEVLYLKDRPNMPRHKKIGDMEALKTMLRSLNREGSQPSVEPLRQYVAVSDEDRRVLFELGHGMARDLASWSGWKQNAALGLVPR